MNQATRSELLRMCDREREWYEKQLRHESDPEAREDLLRHLADNAEKRRICESC